MVGIPRKQNDSDIALSGSRLDLTACNSPCISYVGVYLCSYMYMSGHNYISIISTSSTLILLYQLSMRSLINTQSLIDCRHIVMHMYLLPTLAEDSINFFLLFVLTKDSLGFVLHGLHTD